MGEMVRRAQGVWPAEDALQPMEAVGSSRRSATGSSAPARMGVFARMMEGLASEGGEERVVMIDVSRRTPCVRVSLRKYLKAHRTASSLWAKVWKIRKRSSGPFS